MTQHKKPILRHDYRPPEWLVPRVELEFDLRGRAAGQGQHRVVVRCRQWIEAQSCEPGPLRLQGRHMDLLEIRADGQRLDAERYQQEKDSLTLSGLPQQTVIETTVEIDPFANQSLEGLYGSTGLLCTQCEAHGFSRITYFQDRPDVLSRYRVSILAEADAYPVLLSNGNRIEDVNDGGMRRVVWDDPHPKPCYLFALVAGELNCVTDRYRTTSGRDIALEFYCDPGLENQLGHAIRALKQAMSFDEARYAREYDLDLYMVVVARAFNMGAMENKGLNIFNPKCVLASPATATDEDHVMVEAVIGHEYLHNWTGNRITCRDWFQLALKEGLTVFREQQFSAANAGGPAQRIDEVRMLRSRQFVEDAGPLSHPVRPVSYRDMNNFYTVTVYEKGAELVRVLQAMLGETGFQAGMQTYFERHDGQAATIEDFLACFSDAQGPVQERMLRWYDQAGTPRLRLEWEATGDDSLNLLWRQSAPSAWSGTTAWQAVPIPVTLCWVDVEGVIPLSGGEASLMTVVDQSAHVTACRFARKPVGNPIPVFSGGFPAPVVQEHSYEADELALIVQHSPDPVARWSAMQQYFRAQMQSGETVACAGWLAGLLEGDADPAVVAELLTPPAAITLVADSIEADPLLIAQAHRALNRGIAQAIWAEGTEAARHLQLPSTWTFKAEDVSRRRLAGRLLELGVLAGDIQSATTAENWAHSADNLSMRLAGLHALLGAGAEAGPAALQAFIATSSGHEQLLDRAFALRARYAKLVDLQALLSDSGYRRTAPNRVRAVWDTVLRQNLELFYTHDGQALELFAQELRQIDRSNAQLSARLLTLLESWSRLAEPWKTRLQCTMTTLQDALQSDGASEQISRLLQTRQ